MRSAEYSELKIASASFVSFLFMSKNGSPAYHISKSSGCERADYSIGFKLRLSQKPKRRCGSRIMTPYQRIYANFLSQLFLE